MREAVLLFLIFTFLTSANFLLIVAQDNYNKKQAKNRKNKYKQIKASKAKQNSKIDKEIEALLTNYQVENQVRNALKKLQ